MISVGWFDLHYHTYNWKFLQQFEPPKTLKEVLGSHNIGWIDKLWITSRYLGDTSLRHICCAYTISRLEDSTPQECKLAITTALEYLTGTASLQDLQKAYQRSHQTARYLYRGHLYDCTSCAYPDIWEAFYAIFHRIPQERQNSIHEFILKEVTW